MTLSLQISLVPDNIDLYPLMCVLLKVSPAPHDGKLAPIRWALRAVEAVKDQKMHQNIVTVRLMSPEVEQGLLGLVGFLDLLHPPVHRRRVVPPLRLPAYHSQGRPRLGLEVQRLPTSTFWRGPSFPYFPYETLPRSRVFLEATARECCVSG